MILLLKRQPLELAVRSSVEQMEHSSSSSPSSSPHPFSSKHFSIILSVSRSDLIDLYLLRVVGLIMIGVNPAVMGTEN